jgi:two-component system sensor histidine kinase/response regulator
MSNNSYYNAKILIVDDKPQNLYVLEKLLAQIEEVEVLKANSGPEALELTLEYDFCLAIVDIQMPEMDGYELVELLRGNPATANLPVIFVSAIFSDEYHHRKGYDAGAVDFMSKPFVPEILLSKVKVFLDLYEQRMKVEELAEKNAVLYEVEKQLREYEASRAEELAEINASKDKFFSIVSHDLRTPFNGLMGNAQLLLMEVEDLNLPEIENMTKDIFKSAQSAYRLLENLLTWSHLEGGRMETHAKVVDLDVVIQTTIDLLEQTAVNKKITITNHVEPGLQLFADENMLFTILRNLIANSLKFTPEAGTVSIFAKSNTNYNGMESIVLSIEDTGIGINPVDQEKLFHLDTHHSTLGTDQEQGAGLGLILCKEMVERNGGKIWLDSEVGKGTSVSFTIPLAEEDTVPI